VDYVGQERRDLKRRAAISARLASMVSSPSLLLTVDEAQRLLGLAADACDRILKRLEGNGVLQQLQRGVYTPGPLITGMPRG
jgi:predicted transcriptional regulator of viral defense system